MDVMGILLLQWTLEFCLLIILSKGMGQRALSLGMACYCFDVVYLGIIGTEAFPVLWYFL